MYRIARYISLIVLVAISSVTLQGCKDDSLFGPKTQFYGVIKNVTQWRVNAWEPANTASIHTLDPNVYFNCELTGSYEYIFKAWLPDGTVIAEFRARVNQLSGDAQVNNVNVDWCWIIGGPFMASAREVTSDYGVVISDFRSDVGLLAPKVQMYNEPAQMSQAFKSYDRATTPREEK